ncbi:MAG: AEC family transporter [Moraxellaceae bacterium]|nr:AEC family transporter [Moraxellaceae bacterium]
MFERIISVVFPVFFLTGVGAWIAWRYKPDFSEANRLTMDVFVPALIFGALAGQDFHIAQYWRLALGMFIATFACGAAGWLLARVMRQDGRTWAPLIMFGNSANLAIPVAMLAFGDKMLQPAVVLFMVSVTLHFGFGSWLLNREARVSTIWRIPPVAAMLAGLVVSLLGIHLWEPAVDSIRLLGQVAIPLNILALGVRLIGMDLGNWRDGIIAGCVRPIAGMLLSWGVAELIGLQDWEAALLIVFGAMPPAVLNFIFAERYKQEPQRVASMVLIGNLMSLVFLPLALWWVL